MTKTFRILTLRIYIIHVSIVHFSFHISNSFCTLFLFWFILAQLFTLYYSRFTTEYRSEKSLKWRWIRLYNFNTVHNWLFTITFRWHNFSVRQPDYPLHESFCVKCTSTWAPTCIGRISANKTSTIEFSFVNESWIGLSY